MAIFPALWLLMLLYGIAYKPESAPLTLNNSNCLRGLSASIIVLGHISFYMDSPILSAIMKTDVIFVGIFFLLSGYGVALSISSKKDYLKNFLISKFFRLTIPVYIAYVLGSIVNAINNKNIKDLRYIIDFPNFFKCTNWFIYELAVFYLFSYILIKIISKLYKEATIKQQLKLTAILLAILSAAFFIFAYMMQFEKNLYSALLCYPLGIIIYLKSQEAARFKIKDALIKTIIYCLICTILCALFLISEKNNLLLSQLIKNLALPMFCISIVSILTFVKIGNRLSVALGNISYEIYLLHLLVINLFKKQIKIPFLWTSVSIIVTILLSLLLHKLLEITMKHKKI